MTPLYKTRISLVIGLVLVLITTHFPVAYTHYYHALTNRPSAEGGRINLVSLTPEDSIILDGNWTFYWHQLILSDQGQRSLPVDNGLIGVPDYWTSYQVDGHELPAGGYASYSLTLKAFQATNPVTIYIPDFGGAYRIYIDGMITAESGIISKDLDEIFTLPRAKLYPITLTGNSDHQVVIELASKRFSGLYMAPILKDYALAVEGANHRDQVRLILFGTVIFSLLALTIIYWLSHKKGIQTAWLPAMGFFVLMRLMMTTEFYSFWQQAVFFNLSYEDINAWMFFCTFALKLLLIFLVQDQFGSAFSKREKMAFLGYYALLYLIYFVTPHAFYNRHLTIILPVASFALEFYAFYKVYHNWRPVKRYGFLVYTGVLIAISGLILDSYYINGNSYINLSMAMLIALSAFLMILSLVYALRIAEVYNDLIASNYRLEVAKRQINMQMECYDALTYQMHEIRAIKHDLRHFITTSQRLLSQGNYEALNELLNEYGLTSDLESNPLLYFCENIVANAVIGYFYLKAKEAHITFESRCIIPKQLSIRDHDLCIILGNALENALEACSKSHPERLLSNGSSGAIPVEKNLIPPEHFVRIEVNTIHQQLLIKVENAYHGELRFEGDRILSTKEGENRGMGIQNIQNVVETYGGYLNISNKDGTFTLLAAFNSIE